MFYVCLQSDSPLSFIFSILQFGEKCYNQLFCMEIIHQKQATEKVIEVLILKLFLLGIDAEIHNEVKW